MHTHTHFLFSPKNVSFILELLHAFYTPFTVPVPSKAYAKNISRPVSLFLPDTKATSISRARVSCVTISFSLVLEL